MKADVLATGALLAAVTIGCLAFVAGAGYEHWRGGGTRDQMDSLRVERCARERAEAWAQASATEATRHARNAIKQAARAERAEQRLALVRVDAERDLFTQLEREWGL